MRINNAILNNAVKLIKRNAPEILTGISVAGVLATSYFVHKAATEVALDEDADPNATRQEKIKKYWKIYIPAGVTGAATIATIVGSSHTSRGRTAAAVTAYSLTEKAFNEYKEKVVEEIGTGKEQKVRDAIAQDKIAANPPGEGQVVIVGGGNVLCCELYTKRYFRSDMETLKRAENEINKRVIHEMYVSLDELYELLGLERTSISSDMGWDSDKLMELTITAAMSEDGQPCLAFDYNYIKPI